MPVENYPYKVSVLILTYNQAEYIKKAVEGAIKQQVDFPYEIIIGDDCSTDGTREILLDYKQRYPDLIRLNLHDEHDQAGIAGRKNNIKNIESARGKYIAFCDGDDYWLSRDKLQKQANFMDAHPEFTMCCTDALIVHVESNRQYIKSEQALSMQKSCAFTYRDVIKEEFTVISSSTFYRREYIMPLPPRFNDVYLADLFLQLRALQQGPGKYFKSLKVGKVWSKKSICNHYLSGRMRVQVRKNDHAIIAEEFASQPAKPYSYKALFFMASALRYKREREYLKMIVSTYKVYAHDPTLVVHWLKLATDQNNSSLKKSGLKFISQFIKLTICSTSREQI
jgi:glycosyltransferase involved in cell wall biosynthesis